MEMNIKEETTVYIAVVDEELVESAEIDPVAKLSGILLFAQVFPFSIKKKGHYGDHINPIEVKMTELLSLLKGMYPKIKVLDEKNILGKIIKSLYVTD
jgi:hypothetical protein